MTTFCRVLSFQFFPRFNAKSPSPEYFIRLESLLLRWFLEINFKNIRSLIRTCLNNKRKGAKTESRIKLIKIFSNGDIKCLTYEIIFVNALFVHGITRSRVEMENDLWNDYGLVFIARYFTRYSLRSLAIHLFMHHCATLLVLNIFYFSVVVESLDESRVDSMNVSKVDEI